MTSPQPHGHPAQQSAHGEHGDTLHVDSAHGHAAHRARSIAGHLAAVTELLRPLEAPERTETVPLSRALGRGLVQGVLAPVSLPPFANSQMDGYAIRCSDVPDGGAELRVAAPVPAGARAAALAPGTAAPIMTGAMIPAGADAVVPIERAVPDRFLAPGEEAVVKLPATEPGTFVRAAGSDIAAGGRALAARTFLGPAQLGLLAALGIPEVTVYKSARVLLVTTGDEVVEPGHRLQAGKIYDANGTLLETAMTQAGLEVLRAGISTDKPEELRSLLRSQGKEADLIVTTGGVSKGAYEVVRQAMADQPVQFLHVAMQPGGRGGGTFRRTPGS